MIARGLFVQVDDPRHIAKVLDAELDPVPVEFFQSVQDRVVAHFPRASIRRAYLARQTRVYFPLDHGERWVMGRVIDYRLEDDGSVIYDVRAPNRIEHSVSEHHLFTRSYGGAGDPAEVLALGAAEAQLWHDARWSARAALTRLRAAACGLEGLASASVELAPHQAAAVRRVSQDPLQRYLLADEVGLGKTIEAGALIRQCLLDAPGRDVLVLVPRSLTRQWRRELETKFGLGPEAPVRVLAHEDAAGAPVPHFLVVDEAHACAIGHPSHETIARLASGAEKLLLLTATPLFGSEEAFLQLLRWLDPVRWNSVSLTDFEGHLARSQEYGRLLLGLRDDTAAFLLRQRIAAAMAAFPDDAVVQHVGTRFSMAETPEAKLGIAAELRDHIADAYRIHHRLLRARRSDLDGWEFRPRAGASVREESHDEEEAEAACAMLEDWRQAAIVSLRDNDDATVALANRYAELVALLGRGLASLKDVAQSRPLFEGESDFLKALGAIGEAADPLARPRFLAEVLRRQFAAAQKSKTPNLKSVVFTSTDARQFAEVIAQELGEDACVCDVDEVTRFRDAMSPAVLVLDRGGEEGLNLHFGDVIIHADLPLDVVRIEQRIGRLDRFGRTKGPIRHVVVTPSGDDETPWSSWIHWLRAGLGIFDRSTSDIQFVIADVEADLRRRLLNGSTDDEASAAELADKIANERQKLDEQYALDQLALAPESSRQLVSVMEDGEADEAELADQVGGFLRLLNFGGQMTNDVFSLSWSRDTLIPETPWRPVFEAALRTPLTWRRRIAQARPNVALLRPGARLFEAVDRLLEWDDRGSAFATWRTRPGLGRPGEERLALKLCWQIAPKDLAGTGLLADRDLAGLRRQAQEALPPWTLVQYLDLSLRDIQEDDLLAILEQPYSKVALDTGGRDYNLGSRPGWLRRVIEPAAFSMLCAAVREDGRARVQNSTDYAERLHAAEAVILKAAERRRRRHAVQANAGFAGTETITTDDLLDAVRNPDVRLESIGVFVLAGYTPTEARA